jgi:oligosaccharide repeat unit polymerase
VLLLVSLPSTYEVIVNFRNALLGLMSGPTSATFESSDIHSTGRDGIHFFSVIQGLCMFLTPLTLLYYLTLDKKKKLVVIGLLVASVLNVLSSASTGARGEIVFQSLIFILLFSFFSKFMDAKIKRIIIIVFVIMGVLLLFTFLLITLYKFGYYGDNYIVYSIYNYFSQSFLNFNNYGLDADGIRYGTRSATLITSFLIPSSPINYSERIAAFSNMKLNESNFYTFIGEFTLDYGPYMTIIIFVLFYFFIRKKLQLKGIVPFYKLFPMYFIIKIFAAGWTLYPFCNMGGNLQIITLIIVYLYFKNDYLRQNKIKTISA